MASKLTTRYSSIRESSPTPPTTIIVEYVALLVRRVAAASKVPERIEPRVPAKSQKSNAGICILPALQEGHRWSPRPLVDERYFRFLLLFFFLFSFQVWMIIEVQVVKIPAYNVQPSNVKRTTLDVTQRPTCERTSFINRWMVSVFNKYRPKKNNRLPTRRSPYSLAVSRRTATATRKTKKGHNNRTCSSTEEKKSKKNKLLSMKHKHLPTEGRGMMYSLTHSLTCCKDF